MEALRPLGVWVEDQLRPYLTSTRPTTLGPFFLLRPSFVLLVYFPRPPSHLPPVDPNSLHPSSRPAHQPHIPIFTPPSTLIYLITMVLCSRPDPSKQPSNSLIADVDRLDSMVPRPFPPYFSIIVDPWSPVLTVGTHDMDGSFVCMCVLRK